ncbi:MAG TPA: hypothetical protein VK885_10935 [Desulfotignum sp.]|nr:hypothetical protein [Desulfotignum sp.]
MVLALSDEGVARRKKIFAALSSETYVLKEASVAIPDTRAQVEEIDFKALKIKKTDWALASLAVLAKHELVLNKDMLVFALKSRFNEIVFNLSMETVKKIL